MIDVKDKKREEIIDKNESDKSEMFFISSMINCMIDIKNEKKEEVIDRIESDKSESRKTWKSEENKNKDDITEEHVSIMTKTFWSFECIARKVWVL